MTDERQSLSARKNVIKGIIHCHSDLSYDGQVGLAKLCMTLRQEGFDFVALTEHSEGITPKQYAQFIIECKKNSGDDFVVIPGLEILCVDGVEIAGVGVEKVIKPGSAEEVIFSIKKAGGFAVWVHPKKRGALPKRPYKSHAIELLNGKQDGTVAPEISLARQIYSWKKQRFPFFVIFGLDLHSLEERRSVWTECAVLHLSKENIVNALLLGKFRSHVSGMYIDSSGRTSVKNFLKLYFLRILYVLWNYFLSILPDGLKKLIVTASRPLVRLVKP